MPTHDPARRWLCGVRALRVSVEATPEVPVAQTPAHGAISADEATSSVVCDQPTRTVGPAVVTGAVSGVAGRADGRADARPVCGTQGTASTSGATSTVSHHPPTPSATKRICRTIGSNEPSKAEVAVQTQTSTYERKVTRIARAW